MLNPHQVENLVVDLNASDPDVNELGLIVNVRDITSVNLVKINNQLKEFSDRVSTMV